MAQYGVKYTAVPPTGLTDCASVELAPYGALHGNEPAGRGIICLRKPLTSLGRGEIPRFALLLPLESVLRALFCCAPAGTTLLLALRVKGPEDEGGKEHDAL